MKKNKTKYIFECTAPDELTEFNKAYNRGVVEHCERRKDVFVPTTDCLTHYDCAWEGPCKYLKIHTYKGG